MNIYKYYKTVCYQTIRNSQAIARQKSKTDKVCFQTIGHKIHALLKKVHHQQVNYPITDQNNWLQVVTNKFPDLLC